MKKKIFLIILMIFAFASLSFAQAGSPRSSGLLDSDTAILAQKGFLYAVLIVTDGSNDASVVVYDNASAASGTVLFKGTVAAASNFGGAGFPTPLLVSNGIYVDVEGTNAAFIVYYFLR